MTEDTEGLVTHVIVDPATGATQTHTETADEHADCVARLHESAMAAQEAHAAQAADIAAADDG